MNTPADEKFMELALQEAQFACEKGEVPIGAVAVKGEVVMARAHNLRESTQDPLGHAELLLLKELSQKNSSWRLNDITLYVTLEPCLMCMGAILQARIGRLVFGAMDPEAGVCGSVIDLSEENRLNHHTDVTKGVLKEPCSKILINFFKNLRKSS